MEFPSSDRAENSELSHELSALETAIASGKDEECAALTKELSRRRQWTAALLVMLGTGAGITAVVKQHVLSPTSSKINRAAASAPVSPGHALELELAAYNDRADYREAERLCDLALARYRQASNQSGVAEALARKGQAVEAQGEYTRAKACYQSAISIRKQRNEPLAIAHLLEMLSGLAQSEGAYKEADKRLQQSQTLRQKGNDVVGVALCLRDRGILAAEQCQYKTAARYYRECLRLIATRNKPEIEAHVHALQGIAARDQGDFKRAHTFLTNSLAFWQARSHPRWIAGMQRALAVTAFYEGSDAQSQRFFEESLKGYERVGDRAGEAETQLGLARVLAHQGQVKEASLLMQKVMTSSQQPKSPLFLARSWEAQGESLADTEPDQAAFLLARAQAQRQKLNCPLPPAEQTRMQSLLKRLP